MQTLMKQIKKQQILKKIDDADTTEADTEEGSDDTETADTDKEGEAVKESETTEAEVEKMQRRKTMSIIWKLAPDAKISTVKSLIS